VTLKGLEVISTCQAKDIGDTPDSDWEIVVSFEPGAGFIASVVDGLPVGVEELQKVDKAVHIAGVDAPAAVEPVDDPGGRGVGRTYVQYGTAGGHDAVGLAGDDRATGLG